MGKSKKLTARELITTEPGASIRHREYILSLLQGGVGMIAHYNTSPEVYATFVLKVADDILEKTEQ